jgi:hypothetical protein
MLSNKEKKKLYENLKQLRVAIKNNFYGQQVVLLTELYDKIRKDLLHSSWGKGININDGWELDVIIKFLER